MGKLPLTFTPATRGVRTKSGSGLAALKSCLLFKKAEMETESRDINSFELKSSSDGQGVCTHTHSHAPTISSHKQAVEKQHHSDGNHRYVRHLVSQGTSLSSRISHICLSEVLGTTGVKRTPQTHHKAVLAILELWRPVVLKAGSPEQQQQRELVRRADFRPRPRFKTGDLDGGAVPPLTSPSGDGDVSSGVSC